MSDEPAWAAVEPVEMTMYQPTFGGAMTERTEIRVGHDGTHLYVAGRFYDSEPDRILTGDLQRDGGSEADDYFNVAVDAFNDDRNVQWFYTTPAGIRGDIAISNDTEGQNAFNQNWDAFWDVATARTDEGWFAEVRIPFSTLGFQSAGGRVEMGLALSRLIARKGERHVFPAIEPNGGIGFVRPSAAQDIVLEGAVSRRPVYITPYALGGLRQDPVLDGAAFNTEDDPATEVGLDVRYNLSSTVTADLTVNTDFAQVEADDQQVNLTRFSLFLPEKRPFFQERAGLFEYSLGFRERLFHSRQIGLADGQPVRILGGARVVGRAGEWDFGALDMQTAESPTLPAENFGVARARRTVFNERSHAGVLATSRIGNDGTYNVTTGLDGLFRVVGDEYLSLKASQTVQNGVDYDALEASFLQAQWQRRRQQGLSYRAWLTRWGRDYLPAVGFVRRTDYSQAFVIADYAHFLDEASPLRRVSVRGFSNAYVRNATDVVETAFLGAQLQIEGKRGAQVGLNLGSEWQDLEAPFAVGGDAVVPAGAYRFTALNVEAQSPSGRRFLLRGGGAVGGFYDGTLLEGSVRPQWTPSKHLGVEGTYRYSRVRFDDREQSVDSHLFRMRVSLALDRRLSGSVLTQYATLARKAGSNVRLRYNLAERNDLWVVYTEGINTDRDRPDPTTPVPPRFDGRSVLVKYTHTLTL